MRGSAPRNGAPVLEDVGSSAGTFLDDTPVDGPVSLRDGARIRLGTFTIAVERHRDTAEAGPHDRRAARGEHARLGGERRGAPMPPSFGFKPRVRSGYALKRLDESEGNKRFVLRDLNTGKFLRLSDRDAEVFQLLDGSHSLVEIIGARRAALRRRRLGARRAAARRPRIARLPRRRGRARTRARSTRRRASSGGSSGRARSRSAGSARCSRSSTSAAAGCCSRGRC